MTFKILKVVVRLYYLHLKNGIFLKIFSTCIPKSLLILKVILIKDQKKKQGCYFSVSALFSTYISTISSRSCRKSRLRNRILEQRSLSITVYCDRLPAFPGTKSDCIDQLPITMPLDKSSIRVIQRSFLWQPVLRLSCNLF